jgi:hypothetical protein
MVMIKKRAFLVLAVGVLMGTMAVAALADYSDRDLYEPADASLSADPEKGLGPLDPWAIREPMETGAVPDRPESSSDMHSNPVGDAPTVEIGGVKYRPDIDLGP